MPFDYFWQIYHATIADINCIAVKNFVKFCGFLENLGELPMEGNCQVNDLVYKCDSTRPLPKESESWTCRGGMQ